MLAYILAIAIALTSFSLYLCAFFLPELHRKDDFLWSGVGLFYALILWVCAGRITGAVLLGQAAAVSILLSFGWQTVRLRGAIAHPEERTDLNDFSLLTWLQSRFGGKKKKAQPVTPAAKTAATVTPEKVQTAIPVELQELQVSETVPLTEPMTESAETVAFEEADAPDIQDVTFEVPTVQSPQPEAEKPPVPSFTSTDRQSPPQPKRGFSWKSLFSFGKSKPQVQPQSPSIADVLERTPPDAESSKPDEFPLENVLLEEAITDEFPFEDIPPVAETPPPSELPPEIFPPYEADFEPFLGDDAETVIEDYQPLGEKLAETGTETIKIEVVETTIEISSPSFPIEEENDQPSATATNETEDTDKKDQEIKE